MKRRTWILLIALLTVSLLTYWWLGGFSKLSYEWENSRKISVYGEEFTGRPTQKELENLFYKYRDRADSLGTSLIVISYPGPDTSRHIRQFIGLPASSGADSGQVRTFEARRFVRVVLGQNLMVTPSPEKVMEGASDFAAGEEIQLSGESLEFYSRDDDPIILFPVEDN